MFVFYEKNYSIINLLVQNVENVELNLITKLVSNKKNYYYRVQSNEQIMEVD